MTKPPSAAGSFDRVRRFRGSFLGLYRSRLDLLSVIPAAVVAFAVLARLLPPRSGPMALAMVLEVHLFIVVFVVLAPIALLARARALGVALVLVVVAGGGLFGSEWISLPSGGRHDLSVMTWNLQYGTRTAAETATRLEPVTVDVIALQEIEPDVAVAVEADTTITTRYPYRAMTPRIGAYGVSILSRYPIENVTSSDYPAYVKLTVDTPRGPVVVIDGHTLHADIETVTPLRIPIGYNSAFRDAGIAGIRVPIDATLASGDRLVVVGDFNTSPSETEFAVLTGGLRDTHGEVGEGPGWTWRPSRLTFLPLAFLRIDVQLTAGPIRPVSTSIDCSLTGDHCRLFGDYEIDD